MNILVTTYWGVPYGNAHTYMDLLKKGFESI